MYIYHRSNVVVELYIVPPQLVFGLQRNLIKNMRYRVRMIPYYQRNNPNYKIQTMDLATFLEAFRTPSARRGCKLKILVFIEDNYICDPL